MGFLDGGLGGLAGGILGSIGSIWQNKTQLKIARETNAMNRQMFDDQLAYNTDMWNKQNEYNDPLAQRQRLENAGLNPLFFGLDGTGNASGWQSATPVPAQGAAVNNPLDPLSQGVSSMVDQQLKASQTEKNLAETMTENLLRHGKFVSQQYNIDLTKSNIRLTESEADQSAELIQQIKLQNEYFPKDYAIRLKQVGINEFLSKVEENKAATYSNEVASQNNWREADIVNMRKNLAIDWYNAITSRKFAQVAEDEYNMKVKWQDAEYEVTFGPDGVFSLTIQQMKETVESLKNANDSFYYLLFLQTLNDLGQTAAALIGAKKGTPGMPFTSNSNSTSYSSSHSENYNHNFHYGQKHRINM